MTNVTTILGPFAIISMMTGDSVERILVSDKNWLLNFERIFEGQTAKNFTAVDISRSLTFTIGLIQVYFSSSGPTF